MNIVIYHKHQIDFFQIRIKYLNQYKYNLFVMSPNKAAYCSQFCIQIRFDLQ